MLRILTLLCIALSMCNATSISRAIVPLQISGITDCGVANLVDLTFAGCSSAPCQVSKGQTYDLRISFRPRDFHADMQIRTIIMKETQLEVLNEGPVPDSTLQAGQLYDFDYTIRVPQSISGESEFRLKLFQNYVHELCLVIPLNIN